MTKRDISSLQSQSLGRSNAATKHRNPPAPRLVVLRLSIYQIRIPVMPHSRTQDAPSCIPVSSGTTQHSIIHYGVPPLLSWLCYPQFSTRYLFIENVVEADIIALALCISRSLRTQNRSPLFVMWYVKLVSQISMRQPTQAVDERSRVLVSSSSVTGRLRSESSFSAALGLFPFHPQVLHVWSE